MSITVNDIVTNLDTNLSDTSTDRVSAAERLQAITEATIWLQQELGNDHQNATYSLNYYDDVHYYKITTAIANLLETADLRRGEKDQTQPFTFKAADELAIEIATKFPESSYAIERRDGDSYLVVNHRSKYQYKQIDACDNLTQNGSWLADTAASDATNLTVDNVEYEQGTGSFNFDVDVSQSGNNRATIYNTTMNVLNLSSYEDLAAFIIRFYLPDVTNFSSFTLYWGSDSSNYWSVTVTTDITGSPFIAGWNRVKFDWSSATMTGTPDVTAVDYMRIDFNYTGSQTDDTNYRIDDIQLTRPERLKFHYITWKLGTSNAGAALTAFTATNDIPYFSGQYDQYKFAVAHMAAALLYNAPLRLHDESDRQYQLAEAALKRVEKIVPSSKKPPLKSFKVTGVNFSRFNKRYKRRG